MTRESQQKSTVKFSDNLRFRAARLNLQANEIAEHLGIEPSAVSNWMNGVNMPKPKNIRTLAGLLKCDPDWLLGKTDTMVLEEPAAAYATPSENIAVERDMWRRRAKEAEQQLHDLRTGLQSLLALTGSKSQNSSDLAKLLKRMGDQYDQTSGGNETAKPVHEPVGEPSA